MSEDVLESTPKSIDGGGRFLALIKAAMSMPGAKVDRESFLLAQLKSYCPAAQVNAAIASSPAHAHVSMQVLDKSADSVIKSHKMQASTLSFGAGVLGFTSAIVAIPADAAQFMWHSIVVAQKLAYLYGWPALMEEGTPDEETQMRILLLLGSMYGAAGADHILREVSRQFAIGVAQQLPKQALTKTAYYPIIKQLLKLLGIKLTKKTFAESVSKVVPVLGGGLSAGVTAVTLHKVSHRLKNHLRELEYAKPTRTSHKIMIDA